MPNFTNIIDKKLFEKRNRDDIFFRDVTGGLLKVLNSKLVYQQVWDDAEGCIEDITVPFFYDMGNVTSERFLQDNYITFGNQCGFKKINGNFDVIPRGIISLESAKIEAESITNRMVMGEYQREDPEDGKIKTYVAFLYSIPMNLTYTCEIRSSSFTEMLKISQACNEFFYKNKTFYINYKGMKLGCRVGFPDSFLGEKNTGYTMGGADAADKINLKQTFELSVECYHPVFDKSTERLKSNVIRGFAGGVEVASSPLVLAEKTGTVTVVHKEKENSYFYSAPYYFEETVKIPSDEYTEMTGRSGINEPIVPMTSNYGNGDFNYSSDANQKNGSLFNLLYLVDDFKDYSLFPSNAKMRLRWQYRKYNADVRSVLIQFQEKTGEYKDSAFQTPEVDSQTIALINNDLEYEWYIPKDFTGFDGTDLLLLNDDMITVYQEPVIKVVPDPETMEITDKSFFCLDPGYFICPFEESSWDKKEKNQFGSFSYYCHISAELTCKNKKGGFDSYDIIIPIKDNKVETCEDNPNRINFARVMEKPISINYTASVPYRVGDIVISDANNPQIFCRISNIKIV